MALTKYITQEGQNIFDVVLLKYGTLDELFKFFADNPAVDINTEIVAGQELKIDDTVVGDETVKNNYIIRNFVTNNADNDFVPFVDQKQFMNGELFDYMNEDPYTFN